jgi:hypothetical protein
MTNGTSITIPVFLKDFEGKVKRYTFYLKVYRVTENCLFLGRDFYIKWAGKLPGPIHHEIEILAVRPSGQIKPEIYHSHKSIEGKPFICYPPTIPDLKKLREVLRTWCLGTALSMIWDFDFQEIFNGGMSHEEFWEIMELKYGLTC